MRRRILLFSMFICLVAAIGQADLGCYTPAAILAIWPVFVLVCNLIDSVRRHGW